jgi:hypothetical protein
VDLECLNYAEDANADQKHKPTTNVMTGIEKGFRVGVVSLAETWQRLAFPKSRYKLPIEQFSVHFFFCCSLVPSHSTFFVCNAGFARLTKPAWKLLASFMHKSIKLRGEQLTVAARSDERVMHHRPTAW